ncbi:MAG: DMT family transporter [Wolinella sp.]
MSNARKGALYLALCIILWSMIPLFAKLAQTSLDHHQYLLYSSIFSFVSLVVVAIFRGEVRGIFSYSLRTLLFLAFLGLLDTLYNWLLYFGYRAAKDGVSVLVFQYSWPIFIVLLAPLFLPERLSRRHGVSLALGFLGVWIVINKGEFGVFSLVSVNALVSVMLGAFAFALFSVLSKRLKASAVHAVGIYFACAILYSSVAVEAFSEWILPSGIEWLYIAINGIFLNGVSYIFWIEALRLGNASRIATLIFLIPPFSALWLVLFLNEPLHFSYALGLFLVIASGVISAKKCKQ